MFFNESFNITGYTVYINTNNDTYNIIFRSHDKSHITSLRVKIGIFERKFSSDEEEIIENVLLNKMNFKSDYTFSNISELSTYLSTIKFKNHV